LPAAGILHESLCPVGDHIACSKCFRTESAKAHRGIEFFGYAGIDLNKVKAALPFHEGDEFGIETVEEKRRQAREAVERVTGHPPTDIAVGCCDQGNWSIYIGLSGKPIHYNPQPKGAARLPGSAIKLYDQFTNANAEAIQKGAAAEEWSKGYALSQYQPLRSLQLEMRAYAVGHEAQLRTVLVTSSDDQQRIVAAELLGYARRSKSQIAALVSASRDTNSLVRNNATRALMALAQSNPKVATEIPAGGFIELLLSGTWTDLNKASSLLSSMTRGRSPELLAHLCRGEVLDRLIEMA
jgi:HEAT repeats